MTKAIFPSAYIVGTQKSGSTTLYHWLSQHPDIYGNPAAKDFPFFSDKDLYQKGVKELLKFYVHGDQHSVVLGGESNLTYATGGLQRLSESIPDIKILLALRNPVDRCFSAWRYAVERGIEKRGFAGAINDELNNVQYVGLYETRQKDYLNHGMYAKQIVEAQRYFSTDNMQVILYDDIIKNPEKVVADLFEFFDIDKKFKPVFTVKNKTLGGAKYSFLTKVLYRRRSHKGLFLNILRAVTSANMRMRFREFLVAFNRVAIPEVEFPEPVRQALIQHYRKDIEAVEDILDIELDNWKR